MSSHTEMLMVKKIKIYLILIKGDQIKNIIKDIRKFDK